jgi:hypothetical protein
MFKVVRIAKRGALTPEQFRRELQDPRGSSPSNTVVSLSTGEVALGGKEAPFDGMAALIRCSSPSPASG